ncbi:MAG TPA: hypothetical protein PKA20_22020 [Burkholderiaceae bacterium]|nr:hypothetical protein [Burkholderiaceae bacterium]
MILADPHALLRRFVSDRADSHASPHRFVNFSIPAFAPPAADAAVGNDAAPA